MVTMKRVMRCLTLAAAGLICAGSLAAQDIALPEVSDRILSTDTAILRGLDRVAGTSVDIALSAGQDWRLGPLVVTMTECRYPADNPLAEAYAWIDVYDSQAGGIIFSGWMIASSPALNALDHRRYDLWVLNCKTS